jgi:hypothetical protein
MAHVLFPWRAVMKTVMLLGYRKTIDLLISLATIIFSRRTELVRLLTWIEFAQGRAQEQALLLTELKCNVLTPDAVGC